MQARGLHIIVFIWVFIIFRIQNWFESKHALWYQQLVWPTEILLVPFNHTSILSYKTSVYSYFYVNSASQLLTAGPIAF